MNIYKGTKTVGRERGADGEDGTRKIKAEMKDEMSVHRKKWRKMIKQWTGMIFCKLKLHNEYL